MCGSESAIFLLLMTTMFMTISRKQFKYSLSFYYKMDAITTWSSTTTQRLHSFKLIKLFTAPQILFLRNKFQRYILSMTALPGCCSLCRMPFSNVVCMHLRSLVPRPKITVIGLQTELEWAANWLYKRHVTRVPLSIQVLF